MFGNYVSARKEGLLKIKTFILPIWYEVLKAILFAFLRISKSRKIMKIYIFLTHIRDIQLVFNLKGFTVNNFQFWDFVTLLLSLMHTYVVSVIQKKRTTTNFSQKLRDLSSGDADSPNPSVHHSVFDYQSEEGPAAELTLNNLAQALVSIWKEGAPSHAGWL